MEAKEYLLFILRGLARAPDLLEVEIYRQDNRVLFYIMCGSEDKSVLIGKGGRTISAVQQLVYSFLRNKSVDGYYNEVIRLAVDDKKLRRE